MGRSDADVTGRQIADGKGRREQVILGHISGFYGVQGWVRVFSYTRPKANILAFSPWQVGGDPGWCERALVEGRSHGKGIVVRLAGCDDRDQATCLLGAQIAVGRSQLPLLEEGEYYWGDLIGLEVVTRDGATLGEVAELLEAGTHDILVVQGEREYLIPWVRDRYVLDVDLALGRIQVDWDPEF